MKKIIALLMAVLMTAGMLAACSSTPAEDASPTVENTKAQAETAVVSGEKEKVTLKVWADQGELVLTEKLCEKLGISVGDTVEIRNADGFTADFTVSGICENYVSAYAFIPVKQYEEKFESTPEYLQLFLRVKDDSQEMREQLSSQILKSENVRMVSFTQTIRESFENLVKSINYIVFVLIAAAGAPHWPPWCSTTSSASTWASAKRSLRP